jgi:phage-related protein
MSTLLKPINYSFDVIGEVASSMLSSIEGIRNMIDKIRTFLEDIVGGIFGAIMNIIIEFQNITMKIKDMIMKLVGVVAVILFTLDGTMKTMLSLWNGIPGQLVRAL